jgi:hypothetical protein
MTSRTKQICTSALCLTILALAASKTNAQVATPGDYSFTVYGPASSGSVGPVVYQVEVAESTINPSSVYQLSLSDISITVSGTNYLLPNLLIFSSGALEFGPAPTAIYAAGGNEAVGPWDAIFGLVNTGATTTWDGNTISYNLGFSAGPPGTGTPNAPGPATTYLSEASGPFFNANEYINSSLVGLGYSAYFYDPASVVSSVPEPSSLVVTLGVGGAALAFAGSRRLRKLRAKTA